MVWLKVLAETKVFSLALCLADWLWAVRLISENGPRATFMCETTSP